MCCVQLLCKISSKALLNDSVKEDPETKKFFKLLYTIFNICELSGYEFQGRLSVKDKETGKEWR